MKTTKKNRWIIIGSSFAILLNGLLLFSTQSEVVIGKAILGNEQFLSYHAIVIDTQTYWVGNGDKNRVQNDTMAYVYKYNVLMPRIKLVTKIQPLDH